MPGIQVYLQPMNINTSNAAYLYGPNSPLAGGNGQQRAQSARQAAENSEQAREQTSHNRPALEAPQREVAGQNLTTVLGYLQSDQLRDKGSVTRRDDFERQRNDAVRGEPVQNRPQNEVARRGLDAYLSVGGQARQEELAMLGVDVYV